MLFSLHQAREKRASCITTHFDRRDSALWPAAFDCLIVNCRLPLGGSQPAAGSRLSRSEGPALIAVFKCHVYAPSKGS